MDRKVFEVVDQHITYHSDMLAALVEMRDTGNLSVVLPTKPKSNLIAAIKNKSGKDQECGIENLHEYLKSKEVSLVAEDTWHVYRGDDLETIAKNLKEGQVYADIATQKLFCHYVHMGRALEHAFHQFTRQKEENCWTITWKDWLRDTVGLGESYVRKLRGMYRDLHNYSRLGRLAVSLTEMLKLKPKVLTLLATDIECATYWKTT